MTTCKVCRDLGTVEVVNPALLAAVDADDGRPLRLSFATVRCLCRAGGYYSARITEFGRSYHIRRRKAAAETWQAIFAWRDWVAECRRAGNLGREKPPRPRIIVEDMPQAEFDPRAAAVVG